METSKGLLKTHSFAFRSWDNSAVTHSFYLFIPHCLFILFIQTFISQPSTPLKYKGEAFLRANDGPPGCSRRLYLPHVLFFFFICQKEVLLWHLRSAATARQCLMEETGAALSLGAAEGNNCVYVELLPRKVPFSCLCWATSAQMRRRSPWIMIVAPPGHRMRLSLSLTTPSGHQAACETGLDRCMLGKRSSPKSGTLWALSPCRESHCSPLKPPRSGWAGRNEKIRSLCWTLARLLPLKSFLHTNTQNGKVPWLSR